MGLDQSQTVVLESILRSPFIVLFIIWEIVWKGIALWKAARNGQLYWYVAILILNSVGILPIIYVLFFQKDKSKKGK